MRLSLVSGQISIQGPVSMLLNTDLRIIFQHFVVRGSSGRLATLRNRRTLRYPHKPALVDHSPY